MLFADKRTKILILILLAAGIYVRFYFYFGHVFSDDAYYDYLAYTMLKGEFGADYLGYPICLIRTGISYVTAFSFFIFGTNEAAASVFPMIFSILNMILAYEATRIITKSELNSVIVLLMTAFYPTEVLFASVAFTDLFSTVFINSGILLLFIANSKNKKRYAFLSGICFAVSVIFKISVFYTSILLAGLFFYVLIYRKEFNRYIFISLAVLGVGMLTEGTIYYMLNGDFFYRLNVMAESSVFSRHDFFNEGSVFGFSPENYSSRMLKLIFIDNPAAIFIRRTMVFIPLLAVIQLLINRRERKNRLVVYWFCGLLFLYLFGSMSLTSYQPIVLRFTWYLFPLFLPAMMLASKLFSSLKKGWMILSLAVYIVFAVIMTEHLRTYFDMENAEYFKDYLRSDSETTFYTDHFTKYSIDLINGYENPSKTVRLNFEGESYIPSGSLAVCHSGHVSELKKQGFDYPEESYYRGNGFEEINRFGSFIVFEKK